jgi:hypothetical protein
LTPTTATAFFLGILFSQFPYDYPIMWTATPSQLIDPYAVLEAHLSLLYNSPPLIPRMLHIVIATGILGFVLKLYNPSESNLLFDGASLVLYMIGVVVYITNIVKRLPSVDARDYSVPVVGGEATFGKNSELIEPSDYEKGLGREDSLKMMSASHTIVALVLLGVLVLQAGQWYAERKEKQEYEKAFEEYRKERQAEGKVARSASVTRSGSVKKKN